MKLTELSPWHLEQIEKLSKVVSVEYCNEKFEFFSGVPKLGTTKLTPTLDGFTISERYSTHYLAKEDDWKDLLGYFYIATVNPHYLQTRELK